MSTTSETAEIQAKPRNWSSIGLALSLPLAVVLRMGFFFLVIGMLPTLFMSMFSRKSRGHFISTIAAFNFAGVFPDMLGICMQGGTLRALTDKLAIGSVWLSMYGAALLGIGIVWLSPAIAMLFLEGIYKGRLRHLEHLQKKLEDEWGAQIKGRSES